MSQNEGEGGKRDPKGGEDANKLYSKIRQIVGKWASLLLPGFGAGPGTAEYEPHRGPSTYDVHNEREEGGEHKEQKKGSEVA